MANNAIQRLNGKNADPYVTGFAGINRGQDQGICPDADAPHYVFITLTYKIRTLFMPVKKQYRLCREQVNYPDLS